MKQGVDVEESTSTDAADRAFLEKHIDEERYLDF